MDPVLDPVIRGGLTLVGENFWFQVRVVKSRIVYELVKCCISEICDLYTKCFKDFVGEVVFLSLVVLDH